MPEPQLQGAFQQILPKSAPTLLLAKQRAGLAATELSSLEEAPRAMPPHQAAAGAASSSWMVLLLQAY